MLLVEMRRKTSLRSGSRSRKAPTNIGCVGTHTRSLGPTVFCFARLARGIQEYQGTEHTDLPFDSYPHSL
jgi:hypothetical protein